ncbi:transglutaminase-like domain-containing protein [Ravibacter arvi]|uniref:Transglutaminase-like domain-containing protein n=1 Tax=Ravibacter arvi TaxID=2051041 RepID=A0ABP8LMR7_9BACT
MTEKEIRALVSLLDDDDEEVIAHVEGKIRSMGSEVIRFLEGQWEESFDPVLQKKIEDLVHDLQLDGIIERLQAWVEGGALDLLEGMWILNTYLYPDLSYEKLSGEIEQLYYQVWLSYHDSMSPTEQVKLMNSLFYNTMGLGPNTKNFHAPSNSMLSVVLESKRGNPITLCVIYMLIARKLGMPVYGVNLPNLFVLTYKQEGLQFYINVFNRGIIFSRTDIEHYINQLKLKQNNTFYEPCTNQDIVQRVLRNLILSYEKSGDSDRSQELERVLASISPREGGL